MRSWSLSALPVTYYLEFILYHGLKHTEKMESRDKGRACWIFLSHFVCICGKLSTYTTNPPQGGQCQDMRKEQKLKWCRIPMGKIGLMWKLISVWYNICYINPKKRRKRKTLARGRFFPQKPSLVTLSQFCVTLRGDGTSSVRFSGLQHLRSQHVLPGRTLVRDGTASWSLNLFLWIWH